LPIDIQRRRTSLERFQIFEAATGFGTVCNDVSNGLAVLATQVNKKLTTNANLLESCRVFIDRLCGIAKLGGDVLQFHLHCSQTLDKLSKRVPMS
jgi:hypothetical protein